MTKTEKAKIAKLQKALKQIQAAAALLDEVAGDDLDSLESIAATVNSCTYAIADEIEARANA